MSSVRGENEVNLLQRLALRIRCAFGVSVVMVCALVVTAACESAAQSRTGGSESTSEPGHDLAGHPYVGMWITSDGRIRQELLPNGRYDEARGSRASAHTGRYEVRGRNIEYLDDTGFTADGTFVTDNELHHGGMIFHRQAE